MTYLESINGLLRAWASSKDNLVLYGQNIGAGSCLGGLTRNLGSHNNCRIINTPNSEYTLTGLGFGLMLEGVDSVFFLKQTDFLLLGMDHLVNTYNSIRDRQPKASYTIFPITVDIDFQGPQSSFNQLADLCDIAGIDAYPLCAKDDIHWALQEEINRPGFRIISASQRLFRSEISDEVPSGVTGTEKRIRRYGKTGDLTVVCYNFSLDHGIRLAKALEKKAVTSVLFKVSHGPAVDYSDVIRQIKASRRLIILDDSKSPRKPSDRLLALLGRESVALDLCKVYERPYESLEFAPCKESLDVDWNLEALELEKCLMK